MELEVKIGESGERRLPSTGPGASLRLVTPESDVRVFVMQRARHDASNVQRPCDRCDAELQLP